MRLTPLMRRRLANFRANKRGYWSLVIFGVAFLVSLFAEFIANDRPILVRYDGAFYMPIFQNYPEATFGGDLPIDAKYDDNGVGPLIRAKGWMLWPAVHFSYDTLVTNLDQPAPSPPSWQNPLGTDDQARDVLARLLYGFRISVLFGFLLTILGSAIGIVAGAV
jgi:microcin C transport system permease protein